MEIFGIGASELVFVLIIAIIILGPKDMQKAGRTIGRWLNYFVRSDGWKALQRASQEIKKLPTNLMREANLDADGLREIDREIRRGIDPRQPPPTQRPTPGGNLPPSQKTDASPETPTTSPAETNIDPKQNE